MKMQDTLMVRVNSAWDSWHSAEVRLADLRDLHWLQPDHAPHRLLHGFISCTDIVSGDLAHTCDHRSLPHSLRVCVLKRHAIPEAYGELVRRVREDGGLQTTASRLRPRAFRRV